MTDRETVELQELHLVAPDADGSVARLVTDAYRGEPTVPLLTSIEEERDVAIVRVVDADAPPKSAPAALAPFVSSWESPKRYRLRIAERSRSRPSYFRLAVTDSGINEAQAGSIAPQRGAASESSSPWLLWIGSPVGTHAGLLILLGSRHDQPRPDALEWPLPMSRPLGVRIYDNRA